jgi:ribosomal-protein-alanine N-acetyltransferase
VVCRNDDGAIVGYFGLGQIFDGMFRNAYLGNYAFEPFAGRGYMREGLDLVLRYAFGDLHLHRVQAASSPGTQDRSRWCAARASARRGSHGAT